MLGSPSRRADGFDGAASSKRGWGEEDTSAAAASPEALQRELRALRGELEDRELACLAALSREKALVAALTEAQAVAAAIDDERAGEAAKARDAAAALAESERARLELATALSGLRSSLATRDAEVHDLRTRLADASSTGEASRAALADRLRAATERANDATAAALAAEARASSLDSELRTVRGDAQGMFRVITTLEEQLAARDGAETRVNAALLERDAALNREAQARATADRAVEALRAEMQAAEAALAAAREETKRVATDAEAAWAARVREATAAAAEARARAERLTAERATVESDGARARARVEAEAEHARREAEALRRRLAAAEEERDAAARAAKDAVAKGAFAAEEARRERDAVVARQAAADAAVEAAQRREGDAEAAAEGARRARKEAEAEAERLRRELDEVRHSHLRALQRAGREAEGERAALEARLRDTEAEAARLASRAAALEAERDGRESELQAKWRAVTSHQESQLLACAEEIMRLRARCEELSEAAAAAQREAHGLAVSREEAIAGLYHLRSALDAAEVAHAEVSAQLSAALAREDHAAAHLQDARAEAERLRLASRRLEAQLAQTKDALETSEAGRRYLEGVLAGTGGSGSSAVPGAFAASRAFVPAVPAFDASARLRAAVPPPAPPAAAGHSGWYGSGAGATLGYSVWAGGEAPGASIYSRSSPRASSAPPSSASSVTSPYGGGGSFAAPLASPAGAASALPVSVRGASYGAYLSGNSSYLDHHHAGDAASSPAAGGLASASAAHLLTTTLLGARASPHSHTRHTAARATPASERAGKSSGSAEAASGSRSRRRTPPSAKGPSHEGAAAVQDADAATATFVARLAASTPQPGSARGSKRSPRSPPVLAGSGGFVSGPHYSGEVEGDGSSAGQLSAGRADTEDTDAPLSSDISAGLDSHTSSGEGGFAAGGAAAAAPPSPPTALLSSTSESLRQLGRESPRIHHHHEGLHAYEQHSPYQAGDAYHHPLRYPVVTSPSGSGLALEEADDSHAASYLAPLPVAAASPPQRPASLRALEAALLGGPVTAAAEAAAAAAAAAQSAAEDEEGSEEEVEEYEDDADFEEGEASSQEEEGGAPLAASPARDQPAMPPAAVASPAPAPLPAPRAATPASPDDAGYGDDFEVDEEEDEEEGGDADEDAPAAFEADSLAGTQRLHLPPSALEESSPSQPPSASPAYASQFDKSGDLDASLAPQLQPNNDDDDGDDASQSSGGLSDYF